MTNKALNPDFIRQLLKKADERLPRLKPVFTTEEHSMIRTHVKAEAPRMSMRGKDFNIRYFTWRKEAWVTVRPTHGFIPMFSMPVKQLMNSETEI